MYHKSLKKLIFIAIIIFISIVGIIFYTLKEVSYTSSFQHLQDTLMHVKALRHFVSEKQKKEVYRLQSEEKLSQDYFQPELLSSTFSAKTVNNYYNEIRKKAGLEPIIIKFASDNPRNPNNKANQFEEKLLDRFNTEKLTEYKDIRYNEEGKKIMYYALPSKILQPKCMRCHSTPEAAPKQLVERYGSTAGFHEQIGNIRALISTEYPLSGSDKFVFKYTLILSFFTFVILAIFIIFYIRFSNRIFNSNIQLQIMNDTLEDKIKEETKALLDSKKQLENVISGSELGYWDWNIQTGYHEVNQKWLDIIGLSQNDVLNNEKDWDSRVHPDDKIRIMPEIEQAIANNKTYTVEFRMKHKDGHWVWIEGSGGLIEKDSNGKPLRACGTHKDISKRKDYELEIIKKNDELSIFKQIIDAVDVGATLSVFDKEKQEHVVIYTNGTFEKVTGYKQEEVLGKNLKLLQNNDINQDAIKIMQKAMRSGQSCEVELRNYKKDGTLFFNFLTLSPIYDSEGNVKHYIGIQHDITNYKEKEKQLANQSKLASLAEMITNISHHWRQPLSAISTTSTGLALKQEYGMLQNNDIENGLQTINKNVQYLSKVIDDFGELLSEDSHKKTFNINTFFENFFTMIELQIQENNVTLLIPEGCDTQIYSYERELNQSLLAFFANSCDAFKERQIEDKLIKIDCFENEHDIQIIFLDNGQGIEEKIFDKIFEPYFTTKHKTKGTGLGLSTTYNYITKIMNGSIEVKNKKFTHNNKEYHGTQFTITIPKI